MLRPPFTWEQLHEELPSIQDLTESGNSQLRLAYFELERRFGTQLFQSGHPVVHWLCDASALSRRRLLKLAITLRAVEASTGFDRLHKKLCHPKLAREALDVLSCWSRFVVQGCTVAFEPKLPHKHQYADLLIRSPQMCYVELSTLVESVPRHQQRETRWLLYDLLFTSSVPIIFAGRISDGVPRPEHAALASDVRAVLQRANRRSIASIEQPGRLTLAVARPEDEPALAAWGAPRGLAPGDLIGTPLPAMEDWRMRVKIRKKAQQLPPGEASLLVLASQEVYLQQARIIDILTALETELRAQPHVSALILTSVYFAHPGERPIRATHKGHRIITGSNGWHQQCTLLLYNAVAACPLDPASRARLECALAADNQL